MGVSEELQGPGLCLKLPDIYIVHINELGKGSFYASNSNHFPLPLHSHVVLAKIKQSQHCDPCCRVR